VQRFVAQSHVTIYARTGGPVKSEDDPVDAAPPTAMRDNLAALVHLERAVLDLQRMTGVVLRYGMFYGPGTSLRPRGETLELISARKFPVLGGGGGVWSFVHVADAAEATVAAAEHAKSGISNVVDDEPASVAEWLPTVARQIGAKRPWRVPRFLGRLFAGEAGVVMMTELRGASNAKAVRELGWRPRHASWRGALSAG
jgi:nucleoside-diphosphate-sugar epimerase